MTTDAIDIIIFHVSENLSMNLSLFEIMKLSEDEYENVLLSNTQYFFLLQLILFLSEKNTYLSLNDLRIIIANLSNVVDSDKLFINQVSNHINQIYTIIQKDVLDFTH